MPVGQWENTLPFPSQETSGHSTFKRDDIWSFTRSRITAANRLWTATMSGFIPSQHAAKSGPYCMFLLKGIRWRYGTSLIPRNKGRYLTHATRSLLNVEGCYMTSL